MITGCRRGELVSLRWRDLDVERAVLMVERNTVSPRSGVQEKQTKTGNQRRISLDPQTVLLLEPHQERVQAQLAELGTELTADRYLFSTAADYSTSWYPGSVSADTA